MEDITKGAGVGPATLYRHYSTREDLIDAALSARQRQLLDQLDEIEQMDDSLAALLRWLCLLQEFLRTYHGLAPGAVCHRRRRRSLVRRLRETSIRPPTASCCVRNATGWSDQRSAHATLMLAALAMTWIDEIAAPHPSGAHGLTPLIAHGYLQQPITHSPTS